MRLNLKLAIVSKGWNQADLAKETGLQEARISRMISGRIEPREDETKVILKALRLRKKDAARLLLDKDVL